MLSHVLCRLRALIGHAVRAGSQLAGRILRSLHSGWTSHVARVASDPGYAAAVTALLGGLLGLIPLRDMAAAIVAGVFGSRAWGGRGSGPFGPHPYPQT